MMISLVMPGRTGEVRLGLLVSHASPNISASILRTSSGQQALGEHPDRAWGLVKLQLAAPKRPDEKNRHRLRP